MLSTEKPSSSLVVSLVLVLSTIPALLVASELPECNLSKDKGGATTVVLSSCEVTGHGTRMLEIVSRTSVEKIELSNVVISSHGFEFDPPLSELLRGGRRIHLIVKDSLINVEEDFLSFGINGAKYMNFQITLMNTMIRAKSVLNLRASSSLQNVSIELIDSRILLDRSPSPKALHLSSMSFFNVSIASVRSNITAICSDTQCGNARALSMEGISSATTIRDVSIIVEDSDVTLSSLHSGVSCVASIYSPGAILVNVHSVALFARRSQLRVLGIGNGHDARQTATALSIDLSGSPAASQTVTQEVMLTNTSIQVADGCRITANASVALAASHYVAFAAGSFSKTIMGARVRSAIVSGSDVKATSPQQGLVAYYNARALAGSFVVDEAQLVTLVHIETIVSGQSSANATVASSPRAGQYNSALGVASGITAVASHTSLFGLSGGGAACFATNISVVISESSASVNAAAANTTNVAGSNINADSHHANAGGLLIALTDVDSPYGWNVSVSNTSMVSSGSDISVSSAAMLTSATALGIATQSGRSRGFYATNVSLIAHDSNLMLGGQEVQTNAPLATVGIALVGNILRISQILFAATGTSHLRDGVDDPLTNAVSAVLGVHVGHPQTTMTAREVNSVEVVLCPTATVDSGKFDHSKLLFRTTIAGGKEEQAEQLIVSYTTLARLCPMDPVLTVTPSLQELQEPTRTTAVGTESPTSNNPAPIPPKPQPTVPSTTTPNTTIAPNTTINVTLLPETLAPLLDGDGVTERVVHAELTFASLTVAQVVLQFPLIKAALLPYLPGVEAWQVALEAAFAGSTVARMAIRSSMRRRDVEDGVGRSAEPDSELVKRYGLKAARVIKIDCTAACDAAGTALARLNANGTACVCECRNQFSGLRCDQCEEPYAGAACDECSGDRVGYPICEACVDPLAPTQVADKNAAPGDAENSAGSPLVLLGGAGSQCLVPPAVQSAVRAADVRCAAAECACLGGVSLEPPVSEGDTAASSVTPMPTCHHLFPPTRCMVALCAGTKRVCLEAEYGAAMQGSAVARDACHRELAMLPERFALQRRQCHYALCSDEAARAGCDVETLYRSCDADGGASWSGVGRADVGGVLMLLLSVFYVLFVVF